MRATEPSAHIKQETGYAFREGGLRRACEPQSIGSLYWSAHLRYDFSEISDLGLTWAPVREF
jgi:hypothetical protein